MKLIHLFSALAIGLSGVAALATESSKVPAYWTYDDYLQKKIPEPYTIRTGHPRMLITPENKEAIRQKIKAAPEIWQKVIADAEKKTGYTAILPCAAIYQIGLVEGFKYGMTKEQYGEKGVKELTSLTLESLLSKSRGNASAKVPGAKDAKGGKSKKEDKKLVEGKGKAGGESRAVKEKEEEDEGETIPGVTFKGNELIKPAGDDFKQFVVPCGYDWLYDLLTADQKKTVVNLLIELQPHYVDGACTIRVGNMLPGAAFYGDGVDDAKAKEMVENEWKIWWDPKSPIKNMLSYLIYSKDTGAPDGYMGCRFKVSPAFVAWKTISGQDFFANMGFYRKLPEYLSLKLAPPYSNRMTQIPLHNYNAGPLRPNVEGLVMATGILSEIDPDAAGLARWWVNLSNGTEFARGLDYPLIQGLLIGDPRVKPKSPEEIKLSKAGFFGGGVNAFFSRSSWQDPDGSVLAVVSSLYPGLRTQKTYNVFSFWKNKAPIFPYRGQLAHHYYVDFFQTLSNDVRFYKGDAIQMTRGFKGSSAPGGSISLGREIGKPLSTATQEGVYDFVRCHSLGVEGVTRNERSVVHLYPIDNDKIDYLLVLDRVKLQDMALKPHVIFQAAYEPVIGKDWSTEDKGAKVFDGHWKMEGTSCATITHENEAEKSHARAFLKVLYPSAVNILKIGGEKHFADDLNGKGTEGDKNLKEPLASNEKMMEKGGAWRFHVVPQEATADQTVLTGIEVTDSKQAKPAGSIELLQSENLMGARIGRNVAVFSRNGEVMDKGSIKISSQGLRRITVADLNPDTEYKVTLGGQQVASARSSAAGTLLVEASTWPAGDQLEVCKN